MELLFFVLCGASNPVILAVVLVSVILIKEAVVSVLSSAVVDFSVPIVAVVFVVKEEIILVVSVVTCSSVNIAVLVL